MSTFTLEDVASLALLASEKSKKALDIKQRYYEASKALDALEAEFIAAVDEYTVAYEKANSALKSIYAIETVRKWDLRRPVMSESEPTIK